MSKEIPFTQTHEDLLKGNSKKIDGVETRLDQKIDGVEGRLDQKIDAVEDRLTQKIDGVEARLDHKIEMNRQGIARNGEEIFKLGVLHEEQRSLMQVMAEGINNLNEKFDRIQPAIDKISNHENRISAIESFLRPTI